MQEVDNQLHQTREQYVESIKKIKAGQHAFKRKQNEMKDTIMQFEKFIVDQDHKISKADKTVEYERKLINQYVCSMVSIF